MILAADIGGTKTRLALFDLKGNILREAQLPSKDFANFSDLLKSFLPRREDIVSACLAIAGPVYERKCKATNLPWIVSADDLEKETKIPRIDLINDLEANAWGLKVLKQDEFFILNEGRSMQGNQAMVSAGTGLGEAGIYWDGKMHYPFACEGGHCDFGPTSQEELDLLVYMMKKYGHVSYERVVSGPALYDLYRFFIDTGREKETDGIARLLAEKDPPKVITEAAVAGSCAVCVRTCELFVSLYGAEASNAALKFFSIGGVFLGGGIAPRLLPFFKKGIFMKAFLDKGRFATLLSQIPVKIVLNDKAALLGAFRFAMERVYEQ